MVYLYHLYGDDWGVVNMTLGYPPYCNSEDLCEDDEPVNAGMCRACSSPVCFGIISSRNFRERLCSKLT